MGRPLLFPVYLGRERAWPLRKSSFLPSWVETLFLSFLCGQKIGATSFPGFMQTESFFELMNPPSFSGFLRPGRKMEPHPCPLEAFAAHKRAVHTFQDEWSSLSSWRDPRLPVRTAVTPPLILFFLQVTDCERPFLFCPLAR